MTYEYKGIDFSRDVFITTRGGMRIPIRIEEFDNLSPNCYPEIRAHLIGRASRINNGSYSGIKDVIFNDPATIILWNDGTKTVVKCQEGDTYDKEKGLALCIAKKYLGNKGNFNEVFKKWIPENKEPVVDKIINDDLVKIARKAFKNFKNLGESIDKAFS